MVQNDMSLETYKIHLTYSIGHFIATKMIKGDKLLQKKVDSYKSVYFVAVLAQSKVLQYRDFDLKHPKITLKIYQN